MLNCIVNTNVMVQTIYSYNVLYSIFMTSSRYSLFLTHFTLFFIELLFYDDNNVVTIVLCILVYRNISFSFLEYLNHLVPSIYTYIFVTNCNY